MVERDNLFEFDAPKFVDIAEEMANGPPDDHDDPWFHEVGDALLPLYPCSSALAHVAFCANS